MDLALIEAELQHSDSAQSSSYVSDRMSKERLNMETEIEELRRQIQSLELKNRKYLEVIGGTAYTDPQLSSKVTASEIRETK